jgi:hypothetical protein
VPNQQPQGKLQVQHSVDKNNYNNNNNNNNNFSIVIYLLASLRDQRPSTKLIQVKQRNKTQIKYKNKATYIIIIILLQIKVFIEK